MVKFVLPVMAFDTQYLKVLCNCMFCASGFHYSIDVGHNTGITLLVLRSMLVLINWLRQKGLRLSRCKNLMLIPVKSHLPWTPWDGRVIRWQVNNRKTSILIGCGQCNFIQKCEITM